MFRLVIDFQLGEEEATAIEKSTEILKAIKSIPGIEKNAKFRLQRDEDRTQRNYMDKDENGKARTSKLNLF
jgi:hypothetical protein